MPIPLFITLLIAAPLILGGATQSGWVAIVSLLLVIIVNPIIWKVRKDRYFKSEQFHALRSEATAVVTEHNDVVSYVSRTAGKTVRALR